MNGRIDRRQHGGRRHARADDDAEIAFGRLAERKIDGRPDVRVERPLAQIVDEADDFGQRVRREIRVADLSADRIRRSKLLLRERSIDDRHFRMCRIVLFGEMTAADERGLAKLTQRESHVLQQVVDGRQPGEPRVRSGRA
jgi:hypothetical protein